MSQNKKPEPDDIPELDDIVNADDAPGNTPPPNLDLFGDAHLDPSELREALAGRVADELDSVIADIRSELDQLVESRLETRLRARLETLIDEVLAERSNLPKR